MTFTDRELSAIIYIAHSMAKADGQISAEESQMLFYELNRFIDINKARHLFEMADTFTSADPISIISAMTFIQKKYVAAYLGTMMLADGKIDDTEMALWRLVSTLCQLPTMSVQEAVKFMQEL